MHVTHDLLEGLEVSLGRIGLSTAKDAQCCRDIWAREHLSVL
jgi:hypothetical protein